MFWRYQRKSLHFRRSRRARRSETSPASTFFSSKFNRTVRSFPSVEGETDLAWLHRRNPCIYPTRLPRVVYCCEKSPFQCLRETCTAFVCGRHVQHDCLEETTLIEWLFIGLEGDVYKDGWALCLRIATLERTFPSSLLPTLPFQDHKHQFHRNTLDWS